MALAFPRDPYMEFYLDGWTNVTTSVRQTKPITITRGRKDEAVKPQPSKLSFALDNPTGEWSTRNPKSPHYGVFGSYTPVRYGFRTVTADFGTPVVDDWGATNTGETWLKSWSGGTFADSDWQVADGLGKHFVPAAGAFRRSYLDDLLKDVDVSVTVFVGFTNVLGGALEPANITLRQQDLSPYYIARMIIDTDESIKLSAHHTANGQIGSTVTVPGLTHDGLNNYRVRAQIEGETIRMKVWLASGPEPYDWPLTVHDDAITAAGKAGVRSGVAAGNTNTKPIFFSYDNFEVRIPRYAGEIVKLSPEWDETTKIKTVAVEAASVLRRLAQGVSPLQSSLRRSLSTLTDPAPAAYWPCEDGKISRELATGLIGGVAMAPGAVLPKFAANDDFAASAPIPTLSNSTWSGGVPDYLNLDTQVQARFLLSVPAAGDPAATNQTLFRLYTSGTAAIWDIVYSVDFGGVMAVRAYSPFGVLLQDSGFADFDLNGQPLYITLNLDQVGANIEWDLSTMPVPNSIYSSSAGGFSNTVASQSLGKAYLVGVGLSGLFTGTAGGHITVDPRVRDQFDISADLAAWAEESAGDRFLRLCAQEGIRSEYVGELREPGFVPRTTTRTMGPQGIDKITDLLTECAVADFAELYESKGDVSLVFRALESLYIRPPAVTLDFAAGQVAVPFKPVDDDARFHNDVLMKRKDGSEARAVLDEGPRSVAPPPDGVGRHDTTVTVNSFADSELPDTAHFQLLLGTIDEARFPAIRADLRALDLVGGLPRDLMDVNIGDRIDVTNLASIDVYEDARQLVRGYTETLTDAMLHSIAFNTSPASPYTIIVLDSEDARLDTDASTVAGAGIDADDLSMSVATTGALWSTDGPDYPADVTVEGERMTVSAVSGASSPQTFTISARGVNGLALAHAAGESVTLADAAYLAIVS